MITKRIQKESPRSFPHPRLLLCLALVSITFLVYWPVTQYPFVNYDDDVYITSNPLVQEGLTLEGLVRAFTSPSFLWHPLTILSHMLACQFFGLDAGWHHLVNVLLHLASTVLLFLVLNRMTGAPGLSWFVAALFALHPLHVESVAWVTERKDVLSAFFWMLALWGYLGYVAKPGWPRYLLVLLFFALGLLAKPMLVTLPLVLLLLDYWPLGRFPWQGLKREHGAAPSPAGIVRLVGEKIPFLVLSIAASVVTSVATQRIGTMSTLDAHPLDLRIANALVSYVAYLGKMIWPQHLAVFYPFPLNFPLWQTMGSALVIMGISGACLWAARKHPYFFVGWFWYLGTLVPVIGLVQVGLQGMADRYTYIPSIGLFLAIAWGMPAVLPRWRYQKLILSLTAAVVLIAFTVCTWFQIQHWRNSVTLFQHAVAVTSDNYVAHYNLGTALEQEGKTDEAISHYGEALKIGRDVIKPHYNLGTILSRQGRLDEAAAHFMEVLKAKPDYPEAHLNLGITLARQGKLEEAATHFSEALKLRPGYAKAYFNFGLILEQQGRLDEARNHFTEALRLEPSYQNARHALERLQ